MDGADGFGGLGLLAMFGDGEGVLKGVEHEAGALAVHGFVVECAEDLADGEEDGGRVFDGRDLGEIALVHEVELHVEEAVRFSLHGGRAAAVAVGLDVSADEHGFSYRGISPLPPRSSVFNGLGTVIYGKILKTGNLVGKYRKQKG